MATSREKPTKFSASYHISARNSKLGKSRSESGASFKCLSPSVEDVSIHNRGSVSVDQGRSLQEADWRERNIVGGALDSTLHQFQPLL